jgi:hypothetical protein
MGKIKKTLLISVFSIMILSVGYFHGAIQRESSIKAAMADVFEIFRGKQQLVPEGVTNHPENIGVVDVFNLNLRLISYETPLPVREVVSKYVDKLPQPATQKHARINGTFGFGGSIDDDRVDYILAMRMPGQELTSVFCGSLPTSQFEILMKLDPSVGDLPGDDLRDIARFPASRRTFSMKKDFGGVAEQIVAYENNYSAIANANFYRSQMEGKGWKVQNIKARNLTADDRETLSIMFVKDQKSCLMDISTEPKNSKTTTFMILMAQN